MKGVIQLGVGQWISCLHRLKRLSDLVLILLGGTFRRKFCRLPLQLFAHFKQVIQGAGVVGKRQHQRTGIIQRGYCTGDKRALAVAGLDHAAAMQLMQRFAHDGAGYAKPGRELALGGDLFFRGESAVQNQLLKMRGDRLSSG